MATSRKTAPAREVETCRVGAASTASAACRVQRASAGPAQLVLFGPQRAESAQTTAGLEALAADWAAGSEFAPTAIDGPFLLLGFDTARGRAALANDRFGICPVYVHSDGEILLFASDLDALVAVPGTAGGLDPQAIYDYLFFHSIPGPRTIYRNVRKLGPAECLSWEGGKRSVATYWHPTFAKDDSAAPAGEDLLSALEAAVAARATPSCGAFLSGGLDSSTVAGMLQKSQGQAKTFTIGFDADGYDESGYARIAAEHFGTTHHEYFVTPADVRTALPRIAAHYGEPFGNSSAVPAYYCAHFAREHGVETMLAGDGGDELFAGNTRYTAQQVFDVWSRVPAPLRHGLAGTYRALPWLASVPLVGKGARYIEQAEMGLPDRLQSYNFLHRFDPATVFQPAWLEQVDQRAPWAIWRDRYAEPAQASSLQRMLYLDWKFTLADNDLVKVNHMCDLAGVEVDYPMLDYGVVDLSCRLSSEALLMNGRLRGFYKHAVDTFLPAALINKTKQGFGLPFGVWMQQEASLRELSAAAFDSLERRHIFDPGFLSQVQQLHRDGAAGYYGELVWVLTMLALWFDSHDV
ncbi:MAG: asparagine synthase-related protein [Gammaproteobacteria bacterium]